jgi:hypothetical protein
MEIIDYVHIYFHIFVKGRNMILIVLKWRDLGSQKRFPINPWN